MSKDYQSKGKKATLQAQESGAAKCYIITQGRLGRNQSLLWINCVEKYAQVEQLSRDLQTLHSSENFGGSMSKTVALRLKTGRRATLLTEWPKWIACSRFRKEWAAFSPASHAHTTSSTQYQYAEEEESECKSTASDNSSCSGATGHQAHGCHSLTSNSQCRSATTSLEPGVHQRPEIYTIDRRHPELIYMSNGQQLGQGWIVIIIS